MKCFTYTLNERGEGPAGRLPIGSITGMMANDVYYGAAIIDDLSSIADWNPTEITPLQFNQAFPVEAGVAPALTAIEAEVRKQYAAKMEQVAAPYTLQERDTWFIQVKEAEAWTANSSVATPLLTAISTARNVPIADVATNIINKDAQYRTAIGAVLGEQQAKIQEIWTV